MTNKTIEELYKVLDNFDSINLEFKSILLEFTKELENNKTKQRLFSDFVLYKNRIKEKPKLEDYIIDYEFELKARYEKEVNEYIRISKEIEDLTHTNKFNNN